MMDSQSQAKEQLLSELLEFFQQKAGQSIKGEFPGSAEEGSPQEEEAERPMEEASEMPEEAPKAPEMGEDVAVEGEEAVEEAPESTRGFDIEKMKAMIAAKKRR